MRRRIVVALVWAVTLALPVVAQVVIPYTFTAGTVISPDEMNANFSALGSQSLNRAGGTLTNTLTTRSLVPMAANTYDVGTPAVLYRAGYFGELIVPSGGRVWLDGKGDTYFVESSANQVALVTGNVASMSFFPQGAALPSGSRFYLDSGSDTYLVESGANVMDFVAGNTQVLRLTPAAVTISQPVTMTGSAVVGGGFGTSGNLTVAGTTLMGGNVQMSNSLTVNGSVSIGGTNVTDGSGTPSVASGFGSLPMIQGKSYAFKVTHGTGTSTGGTINFGRTYTNPPIVTVGSITTFPVVVTDVTTTQVSIQTTGGVFNEGYPFYVQVRGY